MTHLADLILFVLLVAFGRPASSAPVTIPQASPRESSVLVGNTLSLATTTTETLVPVVRVVDGDTIKVRISNKTETVRMIGIDTPELVDPRKPVQCFAKEASNQGHKLLDGRLVHLVFDATQQEKDKYGRVLAYVFRDDGLFYNEAMILDGYAHEYTYHSVPYLYREKFRIAENTARSAGRGLWATSTCAGGTVIIQ